MMKIKSGVNIIGLKTPMRKPYELYMSLCRIAGVTGVVTDAVRDPAEKYSLHQDGLALDLRLNFNQITDEQRDCIYVTMKNILGDDYDVIYYRSTTKHIHVEYQRYLDDQKTWQVTVD
jgi:hypothetical protein